MRPSDAGFFGRIERSRILREDRATVIRTIQQSVIEKSSGGAPSTRAIFRKAMRKLIVDRRVSAV